VAERSGLEALAVVVMGGVPYHGATWIPLCAAQRDCALDGTLETLAPEQRLNVEGELEIVEVKPTEEGAELVERPILELGPSGSAGFVASAGDRGFAVGRPDVARNVPLDMLPMMDRYFSAP